MKDIGAVFGMRIKVADSETEFLDLVATGRKAGGIDIGGAARADYEIVIDSPHGIVIVNSEATMQRLLAAIPAADRAPREER